ncbi:g413 [Coccomyxa viridis]|uniref:G413 protein n=1 Tax=Coccomyxa viridis TaxID=1274662 RepID=A0ABP1FME0_9CHLO
MLLVAILVVSTITSDGASIINSEARRLSRTMQSIGNDHSKEIHPWRGQEGYQNFLAATAEPASGESSARIGRRMLSDDPLEAAANAVESLAARADAAASAASKAADKQAKSFKDTFHLPVAAAAPTSTTPPATAPVAVSPQAASKVAAVVLAPTSAPTLAPTTTNLAAAPALAAVPAAVAPSAWEQQDPVRERTVEVPNFQLGAVLLEHANLIANVTGGNGSHVIVATRLAQQQLQNEV